VCSSDLWCATHVVIHGRFYQCESYPFEVLDAIRKEERKWLRASASYALAFIFGILLFMKLFF
jgi:hypothetical protein